MSRHPSLLRRLAISLVVVQIVMILITIEAILAFHLISTLIFGGSALTEYSASRARDLLAQSIVRAANGTVSIRPTPSLLEYAARAPTFKYAALDPTTRHSLPGSSDELMKSLGHIDHLQIEVAKFSIDADNVGHMRRTNTQAGQFILVTYGYPSSNDDATNLLWATASSVPASRILIAVSPLILATIAIGWFVARRSLAPLQRAANAASRIDMNSLDHRLPTADAPVEVMPFINAVNDALARVDAGVARQSRFIANAAHELRTPLAILIARIDSPRRPSFEIDLKRDARRMRNIMDQLLAMSRLGEVPAELEHEFDLVEIVERQVMDHTVVGAKSGRQIDFRAPKTQVAMRGNPRAIESVVANLIDNALRAEPTNGTIVVRVTEEASLEVVDHGLGVPEAERETIFEPFWRRNEAGPGAGLGLAIVREIVELHTGRISIETTPGGGATFKVSLPQA